MPDEAGNGEQHTPGGSVRWPAEAEQIPGYSGLTPIGRGGFSVVYRAHQDAFDRQVAVKVLRGDFDERAARRFVREVRLTGRLTGHPHVVTALDAGTTPSGSPYLAMDLYEGGSLADRLQASGPLPPEEVATIGAKIAGALADAHAVGILHRDVKPNNILVSRFGEPALADFGVAFRADTLSSQTVAAFTPHHAAPELLRGDPPQAAADVYALGSTLYQLVTGRPPFLGADEAAGNGGDIAALMYRIVNYPPPPLDLPQLPGLAAAIMTALAKEPEQRQMSAAALAEQLRSVAAIGAAGAGEATVPSQMRLPGQVPGPGPAGAGPVVRTPATPVMPPELLAPAPSPAGTGDTPNGLPFYTDTPASQGTFTMIPPPPDMPNSPHAAPAAGAAGLGDTDGTMAIKPGAPGAGGRGTDRPRRGAGPDDRDRRRPLVIAGAALSAAAVVGAVVFLTQPDKGTSPAAKTVADGVTAPVDPGAFPTGGDPSEGGGPRSGDGLSPGGPATSGGSNGTPEPGATGDPGGTGATDPAHPVGSGSQPGPGTTTAPGTKPPTPKPTTTTISKSCSGWSTNHDPNRDGVGTGQGTVHWNLYLGPYSACGVSGKLLTGGQKFWIWCYAVNAYGNTWFYGRVDGTSNQGWVVSDNIHVTTNPPIRC